MAEPTPLKGKLTAIKKPPVSGSVVPQNSSFIEDSFAQFYLSAGSSYGVLQPPYDYNDLASRAEENNTLPQCIEAMEVNIDGTGHVIEDPAKTNSATDPTAIKLSDFFKEPYPGETTVAIRRRLRNDLEKMGGGYLEILRTITGDLVGFRRVDPTLMRLVRLDPAVPVKKTLRRGGADVEFTMYVRDRRFVQILNGTNLTYFAEYGSSRDLDKTTGLWAPQGTTLPADKRATEMLYFPCKVTHKSPYGIPRWIPQAPSVVGSRKAEEFNLEFFNNGGVPPFIVFLSGGQLLDESRKAMEGMLNGAAKKKQRAFIFEIAPTGGSLTDAARADVKVERFGGERTQDAMFLKYDANCESHVRSGYRLPPLFIGKAEDYSYASAYASYMVAEAQVFSPERIAFDDRINATLMRELDPTGKYLFRSKSITVIDIQNKLKAIEVATPNMDGRDVIDAINEATSMDLKYTKPKEPIIPKGGANPLDPNAPPTQNPITADGGTDSNTEGKPRPVVGKPTDDKKLKPAGH
jgi:PBSX family phage portal protein